jgi:hypothetical protein
MPHTTLLNVELLESRTLLSYYAIEDIGSFGGEATIYDINNHGHVVGSSEDEFGHRQAFVRAPIGGICAPATMLQIEIPGGSDTYAAAINDHGVVIGTTTFVDDRVTRSFRYTDGKVEFLAMEDGYHNQAYDINNRGQILTTRYPDNDSGTDHDIILYNNTVDSYINVARTFPHSINDLGQITSVFGAASKEYVNPAFEHLLLAGTGINNSGTVVWGGSVGKVDTLNIQTGKQITRLTSIDDSVTFIYDMYINNPGVIVGFAWKGKDTIIWIRDGNILRDINALIPQNLGFKIEAVNGINDHGQLVATAQIDGQRHALILTPTGEPFPAKPAPTDIRVRELGVKKSTKLTTAKKKTHHLRPAKPAPKPALDFNSHPLLPRR